MPFVLDNSVVTGWYIPDQATAYTQAIATLLETDRAIGPHCGNLNLPMYSKRHALEEN